MKRIIKFGNNSAHLNAGLGRALLSVDEDKQSAKLADAINEAEGVSVNEVSRDDNGTAFIRMTHDYKPCNLLEVVCDAIDEIYMVDTTICDERSESIV